MRVKFPSVFKLGDLVLAVREINRLSAAVSRDDSSVVADFSESLILDPAFVVTIANFVERLNSQGFVCRCAGRDLDGQLFASGLYALFPGFDTSGYNGEWHLPVTGFTEATPTLVARIVDELGSRLPNLPDRNERFGQAVAELMENVRVHSDCSWGGFICARLSITDRHIRVALADFGKSIPGTLSSVPPYSAQLGNDVIVYEAFKYWVTGKPGQRAGSGLAYAADFVRAIGGVIRAYSGFGGVRIDYHGTCLQLVEVSYPGTLFTMDLPLR